ncbi:MAG: precorrin-6A/cobalt-precorrin-6A reductase [Cytophagales bacterium]|nr:precorrin-6A/cobalt-precorrin-6A reductase [Cytophagales bacterium]
MILLLGGTTEGKITAECLDEWEIPYVYSTRHQIHFQGAGKYRYGDLNPSNLRGFCQRYKIQLVLNAAHPFATELHANLAQTLFKLPLYRIVRKEYPRISHSLINYVKDFSELLPQILPLSSLLALSGLKSIPPLKAFWKNKACWIRIMDKDSSQKQAEAWKFPTQYLILGTPQDLKSEKQLIQKLNPSAVLTKESGKEGGLNIKIEACLETQKPLFVLKTPPLPPVFQLILNKKDLRNRLKSHGYT